MLWSDDGLHVISVVAIIARDPLRLAEIHFFFFVRDIRTIYYLARIDNYWSLIKPRNIRNISSQSLVRDLVFSRDPAIDDDEKSRTPNVRGCERMTILYLYVTLYYIISGGLGSKDL